MLELHWPMHSFARDIYPWTGGPFDPKFMSSMNDVLLSPPYFQPGGPSNMSANLLPPSLRGFGKVTRITSAGKAIVATLVIPIGLLIYGCSHGYLPIRMDKLLERIVVLPRYRVIQSDLPTQVVQTQLLLELDPITLELHQVHSALPGQIHGLT